MKDLELFVVPSERQVERLSLDCRRAETRTSLRTRLASALLPDVVFVDAQTCRLVLGIALAKEGRPEATGQLGLSGTVVVDAANDTLLAALRQRGGASWGRVISALDEALALLRARGATAEHLDRVAGSNGFLGARARTLATAMRSLDATLARAGVCDARLLGSLLAGALAEAAPGEIEALVGARLLQARWLLAWEPSDVAWWRALDDKLAPRGGGARVVLPTFDAPLAAGRARDPLEALADDLTRLLDAPAETEPITPVLGDLTGAAPADGGPPIDTDRVRVVVASDPLGQARFVAHAVSEALAQGACVEKVVIALPTMAPRTLAPLRRALDEEGIVWHEPHGAVPSHTPVVTAAFDALQAAVSLDRHAVAKLLRSGWIDAARVAGGERREAERRVLKMARTLEMSVTAAGADAEERFLRTAQTGEGGAGRRLDDTDEDRARDAAMASQLLSMLAGARCASTRIEHIRAARLLWSDLGLRARAGRGALASFTSDSAPTGVLRAERLAVARDARAWEALDFALDLYESTADRVDALDDALDAAAFRVELIELIDAIAPTPNAGRAGSVRIARLSDVVGELTDFLVVVDASEGVLPRDDSHNALVSETLFDRIAIASGGAFIVPVAHVRRHRELTALAMAASDASAVTLVFAREDETGAPLAPSMVIDALERGGVVVETAFGSPLKASGLELSLRVAREREREGFFLNPLRPRTEVVGDLVLRSRAAQLLASETGGAGRALAVTSLERFARCAFMGFAQVVLGVRETDQRHELPDAREEGTLVHETLAAAFLASVDLWHRRPRPGDDILSRGTLAANGVLDRWQGHAPLRAMVRLRVFDSMRAVLRVAIEDESWDFAFAEQPFGAKSLGAWRALDIVSDDVFLSLRGSIDRVDREHDGQRVRVIDYKLRKTTVADAGRSLGETALQVPLYARVAATALGLSATGAYRPTQASDVGLDVKPSKQAAQRMNDLVACRGSGLSEIERRALAIVASARSGALAPVPAQEGQCRLCAISGACRKPRFAMSPLDDDLDDGDGQGSAPSAS